MRYHERYMIVCFSWFWSRSLIPLYMLVYQLSTQQPNHLTVHVCVYMRCPILVSFSVTFPLQEAWQGHYFLWHGFCSQELRTKAAAVRFKLLFKLSRIYLSFLLPSPSPSFLHPPSPFSLSPSLSLLLPGLSLTVRQLKMSGCKFYKTLSTIPTSTPFSSPR